MLGRRKTVSFFSSILLLPFFVSAFQQPATTDDESPSFCQSWVANSTTPRTPGVDLHCTPIDGDRYFCRENITVPVNLGCPCLDNSDCDGEEESPSTYCSSFLDMVDQQQAGKCSLRKENNRYCERNDECLSGMCHIQINSAHYCAKPTEEQQQQQPSTDPAVLISILSFCGVSAVLAVILFLYCCARMDSRSSPPPVEGGSNTEQRNACCNGFFDCCCVIDGNEGECCGDCGDCECCCCLC